MESSKTPYVGVQDVVEESIPISNTPVTQANPQQRTIRFRYRADSLSSVNEIENDDAESKVWEIFEKIFCFLKGMPVYHVRRKLKFIMVGQAVISTFRIIPIVLGLSYQSTLPLFILYITLILGWHGVNFLIPKYLLFYKIGMQLSLLVDLIWYVLGYNGNTNTVSGGTAFLLQIFLTGFLFLFNCCGLLFGWKLRRIVKSIQTERECDRAAFATQGATEIDSIQRASSAFDGIRSSFHLRTQSDPLDDATIRSITVSSSSTMDDNLEQQNKQNQNLFCNNIIRTSKYTLYNFPFVFFKLQFSRLANVYTTVIVFLCFFSFSPVSPVASLTPLLIVFASSAIKDVLEDFRRKKADKLVNNRPISILRTSCEKDNYEEMAKWKDVQVGNLVVLHPGEDVPADLLLLATNRSDNRVFVETANLDGETNLKIKTVVHGTHEIEHATEILDKWKLSFECEKPNSSLFSFSGVLHATNHETQSTLTIPVDMDNMILRGSEVRSVEWIVGLVVYTGVETRVALNASTMTMKRSKVEKTLNTMFVLVLLILFTISISCTLGNNDWKFEVDRLLPWYLNPQNATDLDNNYIFLSYVILFNNLIPLSMYVTMEGVRFAHARYIENDLEMYDQTTDTPAEVRNSSINEDLGQIQYVFSDKTGTLTRNEMIFAKCSVSGLKYNNEDDMNLSTSPITTPGEIEQNTQSMIQQFGTRFNDPRLIARLKSGHSTSKTIHEFLLLLALCNTVIPDKNEETGEIIYQASSPDEEALVLAARQLGYILKSRDGHYCSIEIMGQLEVWEILNILEFNSDRKRMSVICRGPDDKIRLFCKGADSVLFERLSVSQPQGVIHVTRGHLQEYAAEGLRTLTTAMSFLEEDAYYTWAKQYKEATMSLVNRENQTSIIAELIERDLFLLGATAIEDRLQEGVGDCISSLRKAGINIWVLTGDKKETAISVGMSSDVIDNKMEVIVLDQTNKKDLTNKLEELYVDIVEDKWDEQDKGVMKVVLDGTLRILNAVYRVIMAALSGHRSDTNNVRRRRGRRRGDGENEFDHTHPETDLHIPNLDIIYPKDQDTLSVETNRDESAIEDLNKVDEEVELSMVIDGKTLSLLLEEDIKYLFLAVARNCKSVICCRCSPSQKASVVQLVTQPTLMWGQGFISLAIGDGANDVPMIQSANVGVGIGGKEGRQAVLSSDYSLAQFRYLKRLLLVHGNYSYKRISKLILFSFMKNVALSFSNFWFATFNLYSGLLMYFGILFTLYNALFTTIPIVFVAIYNQDVSPSTLLQYPTLYRNGLDNRSFNWVSFFGWCGLGVWHAFVIFTFSFTTDGYFNNYLFSDSNVDRITFQGNPSGLWADGVATYTYLIFASTLQVSLLTTNWTKYNANVTIGTLFFYALFIWFLTSLFEWSNTDVYETYVGSGIIEHLVGEPWFWLALLCSGITAVLPNYILKAGRVLFYPEPSHLIREWKHLPTSNTADIPQPRLVRRNTGFAFSQCSQQASLVLKDDSHV